MSEVIDDRVVKLEFDNSEFDSNIESSKRSLEAFNNYLKDNMKDSGGYFEDLSTSANNLNFNALMDSINNISSKFSIFGDITRRIFENIADYIFDAGTRLAKSLTIDDISKGWGKFEEKTAGVMTIMAATGKTVDEVSASLEKLNWYTDETSYNYTDMVSNIGKFTAAGVDLDQAVSAMEGIGNLASLSGQGVQQASHAMYNFAQAMGTGAVKLQDWKSIENANMATVEFKQTLMDTAVDLGTLRKNADGTFTTLAGHTTSVTNFNEGLKDAWLSSDVLVKTLGYYSEYADAIYEISDSYDTCSEAMAHFDGSGMELGEKAFKAAQEAKSVGEAIDSVHDAVSTGWMTTFETIFGNYLVAKTLWTDLANDLWDIFAAGGEERNAYLSNIFDTNWIKIQEPFEEMGGSVSDLQETLTELANEKLSDQFYTGWAKAVYRSTEITQEAMDELKATVEFNGETIDNYLTDSNDILQAANSAGLNASELLLESFVKLRNEAEHTTYSTKDVSEEFNTFADAVTKSYDKTKNIHQVMTDLSAAGYDVSMSLSDIRGIIDGNVKSIDDLSDSSRKTLFYQDYANESFDKFKNTLIAAKKEGKSYNDILKALTDAGYENVQDQRLWNDIINGNIKGWKDLSVEQQKAIIWNNDYANSLTDVINNTEDADQELVKLMEDAKREDIRSTFFGALLKILEGIPTLTNVVKEAFSDIFPAPTVDTVYELVTQFDHFVDSCELSEKTLDNLKRTFKGFFALLDIGVQLISALTMPLRLMISTLFDLGGGGLEVTASLGDMIVALDESIKKSGIFNKVMTHICDGLKSAIEQIKKFASTLYNAFQQDGVSGVMTAIPEAFSNLVTSILGSTEKATGIDLTGFKKVFVGIFNAIDNILESIYDTATKYWPYVKTFLTSFKDFMVEAFTSFDWDACAKKLLSIPKAIGTFFKTIAQGDSDQNGISDWRERYPSLAAFVDFLDHIGTVSVDAASKVLNKIKDIFTGLADWLKTNFSDMSMQDIAVLAFSAALIYMLVSIGKLFSTANKMINPIADFVDNVKESFDNLKESIKSIFDFNDISKKVLRIAFAISLIAGVAMAMTQYKTSSLWKSVGIMGAIAGIVVVLFGLLTLIQNVSKKAPQPQQVTKTVVDLTGLGILLIGMAVAITSIAKTVAQANETDLSDNLPSFVGSLVAVLTILTALVALSGLMNKIGSKNLGASIGQAIVILAFTSAIKEIVKGVGDLATINYDSYKSGLLGVISLVGLFAVMTIAASNVKLSSGLGIILIMVAIKKMAAVLTEDSDTGKASEFAVESLLKILNRMVIVMAILAFMTTKMPKEAKIGRVFMGFGICVLALAYALKTLASVTDNAEYYDSVTKAAALLAGIMTLTALIALVVGTVKGSDSTKLGTNMVLIGLAMGLMAMVLRNLVKDFDGIDSDAFKLALTAMIVLTGMITILSVAISATKGLKIGPLIAMLMSISLVFSALGVLYNLNSVRLIETAGSMALVMGTLAALIKVLGKMEPPSTKPILSIAGILLILMGTLTILASSSDNIDSIIVATTGISLIFISLALLVNILARMSDKLNQALPALVSLGTFVALLGFGLGALALAVGITEGNHLFEGLAALGMVMIVLGAVTALISKQGDNAKKAIPALTSLAGAVALIALSMSLITLVANTNGEHGAENMLLSVIAMTAMLGMLMLVFEKLSKYTKANRQAIPAMTSFAAVIAAMGVALALMSAAIGNDPNGGASLCGAGVALLLGLIAMSFAFKAVAKSTKSNRQAIPALTSMATAIGILSIAVVLLTKMNTTFGQAITICTGMAVLMLGLGVLLKLANGFSGFTKEGTKSLTAVGIFVGIMAGIVIGASKLVTNISGVYAFTAAMSTMLIGFAGILAIAGAFGDRASKAMGSLTILLVCITLMGVIVYAVSANMPETDAKTVGAIAATIAGAMTVLVGMMIFISKAGKSITKTTVSTLGIMVGAVALIGGIMLLMAKFGGNNTDVLYATATSISLAMTVLSACLIAISKYGGKISSTVVNTLKALVGAIVVIGIIIGVLGSLDLNGWNVAGSALVIAGLIAGLIVAIKFLNKLKVDASVIKTLVVLTVAVGVIATVIGVLGSLKLNGNNIVKTSIAIGLAMAGLVLAIKVLSKADYISSSVITTLGVLLGAVVVIGAVIGTLDKIGTSASNMLGIAASIALVMLTLSAAMERLSKSSYITKGTLSTLGIMALGTGLIGGVIGAISKFSGNWKEIAATGAAMAGVIGAIALAMSVAAKMEPTIKDGAKATGELGVASGIASAALNMLPKGGAGGSINSAMSLAIGVAAMGLVSKIADLFSTSAKTGLKAIAAIVVAVAVAVAGISILDKVDTSGNLIQAAGALALVIVAMGAALSLASTMGASAKGAGAAVALMAVSILIVASAVSQLSSLSVGTELIPSVIAIAVIAAIMGGILMLLAGFGNLSGAASLLVMGIACKKFATAIAKVSNVKGKIGAVAALAVIVAVAAIACVLAQTGIGGAVALVAMGFAMQGFAKSLATLSGIDTKSLIKAAAVIAVFTLVMVGIGYLATGAAVGILAISGMLLALGIGFLAFGAGAYLFAAAVNMILNGLDEMKNNNSPEEIQDKFQTICDNISVVLNGLADTIVTAINTIAENIGPIAEAVGNLLLSFLNAISEWIINNQAEITETMKNLIVALLVGLECAINALFSTEVLDHTRNVIASLWNGLQYAWNYFLGTEPGQWIKNLVEKIGKWVEPLGEIALTVAEALVGPFINAYNQIVSLVDSINAYNKTVTTTMKSAAEYANSVRDFDFKDAMALDDFLTKGYIAGYITEEEMIEVKTYYGQHGTLAGNAWAESYIEGLEAGFVIESPSHAMRRIGKYVMMGFALGMDDKADMASESMASVFTGIPKVLEAIANSDLSNSLTITPVLDLSTAHSQLGTLSNDLNFGNVNFSNVNFGGYTGIQTRRVGNVRTTSAIQNDSNGNTGNTINYTQNNYSPKALSRMEIYRDTRNQLSTMKGLVSNA